ncbi:U6 snRNA-associated Sm-like protein LSm1 [Erythrolamprus reginae]|uniref:U6 snRNA-associated Sm-like protein LSm1 n=1 Tax=Erythrolamprus reginae TaxID=121349 RepID=UPI00396D017C
MKKIKVATGPVTWEPPWTALCPLPRCWAHLNVAMPHGGGSGSGGTRSVPRNLLSAAAITDSQLVFIIACASGPGGERPRAGSASPRADAGGGASAASGGKMNYMPGTASLIQDIDKKHLVLLRDGRTLIGYLRSIDQFANLVLHQTVERIHVGKKYGDIPRGIFVVRGENVVLLGEIDLEKESDTPLQQVSIEEILEVQRVEQQAKQESDKLKMQALKERGLSVPKADTLDEY